MTAEERLHLIARVLAWQDGVAPESLDTVAETTLFQDYARQCADDLTRADVL